MQRIILIVTFFFMSITGSAWAAGDIADATLEGNWVNENHNGVFTQLEIEENGKFVFRELHSKDLRRSYMCGKLTDLGDALSLDVQQKKERTVSGHVSQAVGASSDMFAVQSRSAKTLVLRIDKRTVVLHRG